jgi:hypothetical protein
MSIFRRELLISCLVLLRSVIIILTWYRSSIFVPQEFIQLISTSHPPSFRQLTQFLVSFLRMLQHLTERTQIIPQDTRKALVCYKIGFNLPHVGLNWDV